MRCSFDSSLIRSRSSGMSSGMSDGPVDSARLRSGSLRFSEARRIMNVVFV